MRRLLVIRHAKAAPGDGRDDYARPLTERGRDDALRIGKTIARRGLAPEALLHSSAERTKQTAEIFAGLWPTVVSICSELGLYDATRPMLFERVRELPDSHDHVALIGHNPGVAELVNYLAGSGAPRELARVAVKYPTCSVAALEFDARRWSEIAARSAELAYFTTPDDLVRIGD